MAPQEIQIGETRIKNWPDGVPLPKGARIIQPEQPAISQEQPQRKTEAEPTAQAGVVRHEPVVEQKPTTAPAGARESRGTESRQQPAPAAPESTAGGAAGAGGAGREGGPPPEMNTSDLILAEQRRKKSYLELRRFQFEMSRGFTKLFR